MIQIPKQRGHHKRHHLFPKLLLASRCVALHDKRVSSTFCIFYCFLVAFQCCCLCFVGLDGPRRHRAVRAHVPRLLWHPCEFWSRESQQQRASGWILFDPLHLLVVDFLNEWLFLFSLNLGQFLQVSWCNYSVFTPIHPNPIRGFASLECLWHK